MRSSGKSTGASPPTSEKSGGRKRRRRGRAAVGGRLVDLSIGATTTDDPHEWPRDGGTRRCRATNKIDSTRITAGSLLVGLERHIGERLTVGIRLPLIYARARFANRRRRRSERDGDRKPGARRLVRDHQAKELGPHVHPRGGAAHRGRRARRRRATRSLPRRTRRYDYDKYDNVRGGARRFCCARLVRVRALRAEQSSASSRSSPRTSSSVASASRRW